MLELQSRVGVPAWKAGNPSRRADTCKGNCVRELGGGGAKSPQGEACVLETATTVWSFCLKKLSRRNPVLVQRARIQEAGPACSDAEIKEVQ